MLASVSKLVDKPFVVGFAIPVLLGAFALIALMRDVPPFREVYRGATKVSSLTELTVTVLLLWAVAIVLMLLNQVLFQMFEGYFGPLKWIGGEKRMRSKRQQVRSMLEEAYQAVPPDPPDGDEVAKRAREAGMRPYLDELLRFHQNWPSKPELVLPTRFGNVIRAFETYPEALYGIDAIPGWVRLQGVLSKDFAQLVEDARAQVSFFVNVCSLSLLFAVIAGLRFVVRCVDFLPANSAALLASWGYLAAFAAGLLSSWLAYESAVERARAWGDLVRSAFDIFLPELAAKLGYELPSDPGQRRLFWQTATSSFLYQNAMAAWPLVGESPSKSSGQAGRSAALRLLQLGIVLSVASVITARAAKDWRARRRLGGSI